MSIPTAPADVMIVAASHRATVVHAYADDSRLTECGRTIGEGWTGEYSEGLGWGLPTCHRCLARVTAAHVALCEAARYSIGQTVGILGGQQSVNGTHVIGYGTVVQIAEYWKNTTEYTVATPDGERLSYREFLLCNVAPGDDDTLARMWDALGDQAQSVAREAAMAGLLPALATFLRGRAMASHPAGKGRTVRIGGRYPQNVNPANSGYSPAVRQDIAECHDLLFPNPWNVSTDSYDSESAGSAYERLSD